MSRRKMRSPEIFILVCIAFSALHFSCADLPKYSKCSKEGILINSARGYVTSPGYPGKYPANQNCKWNIVSPKGTGLRLRIEYLDNQEIFDGGAAQCYDLLRILAGPLNGLKYIDGAELCAKHVNQLRKTVFEIPKSATESVVAQIAFTSDYADHNTGFSIHFEAVCNSTQVGKSGTFASPNYPDEYPNNAECFTEIRAPIGNYIQLEFTKLSVENQASCETDYIAVTKGTVGLPTGTTKRYCQAGIGSILIESNTATIKFVSDGNIGHSGFEAMWSAASPTPPTTTTTTPRTTTSVPTTTTAVVETSTAKVSNCSYTNESKICQRWDVNFPHSPKHKPADPHHNYCRIPDNDPRGPWCYTTDRDQRWGYCDLDSCVPPTTEPTTSSSSHTQTAILDAISPEKQTSDEDASANSWYIYLVIPIALLLLIILLALIFVWRRRRRKGVARVNDPTLEDMVRFNQLERDDNNGRPRENTYVEIPVGGIQQGGGRGRPPHKSANGFVALNRRGSKNSSISSHNSIQMAKEDAKRNFVSVNEVAGSSSDYPYSAADDMEAEAGAVGGKNPYNMANDSENVYHTIGLGKENETFADNFVPPAPAARPPSKKEKSSKKGSSKKKQKNKNDSSKRSKKKDSVPRLGFGNPSYQEKELAKDDESATENPFDTDDDSAPTKSSTGPVSDGGRMSGRSRLHDQYQPPGAINVTKNLSKTTETTESPYMAPKLPLPNKAHLIPISPDAIDDKGGNVFDNDTSVYSTPKPTSPQFELGSNFIYDSPGLPRPASGDPESTATPEDEGSRPGRSGSTNTGRDSGNSSLSAIDSIEGEQNQDEYCTMNSVPRVKKLPEQKNPATKGLEKIKEAGKGNHDNRLSHLYMSMNGTPGETETVPKKFYENESQAQTAL